MNISTPIVLVEDDKDNAAIFKTLVEYLEIEKPVKNFADDSAVIEYLPPPMMNRFLLCATLTWQ